MFSSITVFFVRFDVANIDAKRYIMRVASDCNSTICMDLSDRKGTNVAFDSDKDKISPI